MVNIKKIPSHWIGLADQILVSGANFVFGIILARTFGVEVFGSYVIATSFLFYANIFQSSLVISPMMTAIPLEPEEASRQDIISGFFGYSLILIVVSVIGIALITYSLGAMVPSLHLGASTGPLLLAIIGFQLQDWLRRVLYAQHKTGWVLVLDMMAYGGQFLFIIILYFQKALTPSTALLAMAIAFFISALIILTLQKITPNFSHSIQVVKSHWRGSRDYFIAWQLQWAGSQGLALFGGGVLGPQVVGALRASINLVAPINVLFQWMDNVIPVRAVNHLSTGGVVGMNKFLSRIALVGGVMFGIMVIILYFFAEPLLAFLYGETYRPYAFFVFLQAIFLWLNHFYRVEFFACRATNRTADIARASFIMAVSSICTGMLSVYWVGGSGVILALILGQSISHIYLFFRRKVTQKTFTIDEIKLNHS